MKALVLFSKIDNKQEKGWWNVLNNKEKINSCENAQNIFKKDIIYINYKYEKGKNFIIIIIDYKTTAFSSGEDKKYHNRLRKPAMELAKCILKSILGDKFKEDSMEYLILVHSIELDPDEEFKISNYTIGGSGIAKERGERLKNLFSELNKFDENFEELKKNFYKKDLTKPLCLLKHWIAHLFLPIDIDLQGIYEVNKVDQNKVIKYLKEVLEEKKGNTSYYRQRLADLWYILVKGKIDNGEWMVEKERKIENGKLKIEYHKKSLSNTANNIDCIPVPPREDCDNLLANGVAVIDLFAKDGKLIIDEKYDIKEVWKDLLKHSGLIYDESNPFKLDKIEPDPSSTILKFAHSMDNKISKIENINIEDLKEVLNVANSGKIYFSEWFEKLNEYLFLIIKVFKNKQNGA